MAAQLNFAPIRIRRSVIVGSGSFGTAVAILLARAGFKTTLQARNPDRAATLDRARENVEYLPGIEFPPELKIESVNGGLEQADFVFLAIPSRGLAPIIARLSPDHLRRTTPVISLAKGLVGPDGKLPSQLLSARLGPNRVCVLGGPAHAREMVTDGAGLVAAATNRRLGAVVAKTFMSAGVVCEQSDDPIGVELAGAAKNAATLAAGATVAQGTNAAGAAAGHIFSEVWQYAEQLDARAESMIGLAGTGDLVATTLAPASRNRRAGELLGQGISAREIPNHVGQAVEALDLVPLLAQALHRHRINAPITEALHQLIQGNLPLDDWVALVRTTVPHRPRLRLSWWQQFGKRLRRL